MLVGNEWHKNAKVYAEFDIKNTVYLAYKYIPALLEKHHSGIKSLDYGCGTGMSTRFLQQYDFDVEGMDISEPMLIEARKIDSSIPYSLIKSAEIPRKNDTYDLVFCCFTLFKVSTKTELEKIFHEIHRVLKDKGLFLIVTASDYIYEHTWLSLKTDFPENKCLKSGDLAKITLKDIDLTLHNYYWTDSDYREIAKNTRFEVIDFMNPLGTQDDGVQWINEEKASPYSIYLLKK